MRNKRHRLLAVLLTAGTLLLSGCGQMNENLLDAEADLSVSISVPYATSTPLPEYLNVDAPVVIDPDGAVTVNDKSLLNSTVTKTTVDTGSYQTLNLGDTGIAVQTLQQRLKDLNYYYRGVSGIFDAETETAVKRFEKTFGVMQTGIATPAFQSKLFAADAPAYASEAYDNAVFSHYYTLQRGAVGSSVYALQYRLKELGYPISELTGVYDESTEYAIGLFCVSYGVDPQPVAYVSLQKELYSETANPYMIDGKVQYAEVDESVLRPGNVGTLVMQIQNRLVQLGYMSSTPSGIYDAQTEKAVKHFQEACGVDPTGALNYSIQAILLSEQAPAFGSAYSADQATYSDLNEGDEGDAVLALQNRLVELGFATGAGNGVYGPETSSALKLFQRYNNLEETGVASAHVQSCLYSPSAVTYRDVLSGNTGSHAAQPTPAPTAIPSAAPTVSAPEAEELNGERSLSLNDSGDDVLRLQTRLTELQYNCPTTGHYDAATAEAVRALQAAIGVTQSGEATVHFQRYLYSNAAPVHGFALYPSTQDYTLLQERDTGDAVTRLQQRLWQLGYLLTENVEDSVGTYHDATKLAVASAQTAMNYAESDGIASAEFQCFLMSEYGEIIKK
ncbi:MAG: peptidoglycan-binding protein [Christensenellales bacterium]|nr:peptidoglycan-binding protein [Christensenellales bacterium]